MYDSTEAGYINNHYETNKYPPLLGFELLFYYTFPGWAD